MQTISVEQLHQRIEKKDELLVLDVRDSHEVAISSIGSIHIPMAEILDRGHEVPQDKDVVVCCRTGQRAAAVIDSLIRDFSLKNLLLLEGGLEAWALAYEPSMDIF